MADGMMCQVHGEGVQALEIEIPAGQSLLAAGGCRVLEAAECVATALTQPDHRDGGGIADSVLDTLKTSFLPIKQLVLCLRNTGPSVSTVILAPEAFSQLVRIDLGPLGPSGLIYRKRGFFCAGVAGIQIAGWKSLAGESFKKINGAGFCFLAGGGLVLRRELRSEQARVLCDSLLAFTGGLDIRTRPAVSVKKIMNLFKNDYITLSGTGSYYLQAFAGQKPGPAPQAVATNPAR